MNCVFGDCIDIKCAVLGECERCNEITGECESTCNSDECCDNDTCVDKCEPDGGPCEWTYPGVESQCQVQDPGGNLNCFPDEEGKICDWYVVGTERTTSAKCADCAPNCTTIITGSCVMLKARVCKSYLIVGCLCGPDGPSQYAGWYEQCI